MNTPTSPLPFPVHIPFVAHLGLELIACADDRSELHLDLRPEQLNSFNVAHGGVVMTLLDVAMAHAARSRDLAGPGVVTIEMKTSFMRPSEGRLRAEGLLLHRTATMAFCEASIFNPAGQRCAHATGTFKYLRAVAGHGRRIKPLNGPASLPEPPQS
ncbi:PaaI family thioesterase [Ideonella livida]|uniref:PaaI family thioesterase n=1 Tax=Ideonella livida TaxID=2707176 RepID=A0A7C9PEW0_9BURK|nr:PaaI family thioesterase [Ideonella livida]NDY89969.1 PaaI family thioesterase [Ideonella livida]